MVVIEHTNPTTFSSGADAPADFTSPSSARHQIASFGMRRDIGDERFTFTVRHARNGPLLELPCFNHGDQSFIHRRYTRC